MTLSEKAEILGKKLADLYFRPKFFEKNGRLYEFLGIKPFKKFVLKFGEAIFKDDNPYTLRIKDLRAKKDLQFTESLTRIYESVHSPIALYCTYRTIDNFVNGKYLLATTFGIGALINGYASMLQRYNRPRLYNLIKKVELRENTSAEDKF